MNKTHIVKQQRALEKDNRSLVTLTYRWTELKHMLEHSLNTLWFWEQVAENNDKIFDWQGRQKEIKLNAMEEEVDLEAMDAIAIQNQICLLEANAMKL